MAVSKRLRFEIFRRDGFKCRYCGLVAGETELTIDHVVPRTLGGSDDPTNLVTACKDCNSGKTSSSPDAELVADVDQRAVQWAQAMEIAVARRHEELADERARVDAFDRAWRAWPEMPRTPGWRSSISRFLAEGLDDRFLVEAVDIAMGNRRISASAVWKYFCGICWREIGKIQGIARQVVGEDAQAGADIAAVRTIYTAGTFMPDLEVATEQHPDFPAVNLAATFVSDLLRQTSAPSAVEDLAQRVFWQSMTAAYREFLEAMDKDGTSDGITEAWRRAEERMQSVAAQHWGEIEALCAGTWDGKPGDGRMPQGPGLHPGFDALNLTDRFIADVFQHLGIFDDRAMWAHRGYWAAMEDAYKAFIAIETTAPADLDPEVGEVEISEHFDNSLAWFLNQIWMESGKPTRLRKRDDDGDADGS